MKRSLTLEERAARIAASMEKYRAQRTPLAKIALVQTPLPILRVVTSDGLTVWDGSDCIPEIDND